MLTEAVEAAARAMFGEEQCDRRQMLDVDGNWESRLDERDQDEYRAMARAALSAALPILREELAKEIEAVIDAAPEVFSLCADWVDGMTHAGNVVRGDSDA